VVLVDERTLWPNGAFVTTDVIVRTTFLQQNPAAVAAFLTAHLDSLDAIAADPARAQRDVAAQIKTITEQDVEADLLSAAWQNLSFTADPLASTLRASAAHAEKVGLLKDKPDDDFAALYDLQLLNKALTARGLKEVTS
jgi:NitT/TauT family transport system substrate-binding protein